MPYQYDQPGGIIEGSPGVFFSIGGGAPGAVFSVTTQGIATTLGTIPYLFQSLLVSAANSRFYTSEYTGTPSALYEVFSVSSAANNARTYAPQTIDPGFTQNLPDGRLLGVGPDGSYIWHVIAADLQGNVTSILQLPSTERAENVIYASDGNYYGVALALNASAASYIFRATPSGSLTTLYTFPSGTFSYYLPTPLIQADDGNLYGTTVSGGANGAGMIYKLTLDGQFTLLHSFEKSSGGIPHGPASLTEAGDGNLYGVAQNDSLVGLIFRTTKSGGYEVLYQMSGPAGNPPCWLIQGSDGNLYGVAHAGGSTGDGTVFALDAGLHKPRPSAHQFQPKSGGAGTVVRIWGYNLLWAAVSFNGTPATAVSNSGSNYILATVPPGASSGPITVTTPGGASTTKGSFTVQ